jgi:hypothetical protein
VGQVLVLRRIGMEILYEWAIDGWIDGQGNGRHERKKKRQERNMCISVMDG